MMRLGLQQHFRLWTVTLILLPCLVIMSIYTYRQFTVERQNNLQLISQRVEFQQHLIEYWLEERAIDVRKISQMDSFKNLELERMKSALDLMQRDNRDFDSLSFIDHNGIFQLSTLSGGIRFRSAQEQPYYQAAKAGQEFISDVVVGRNSGLPIINFSAPVYDRAGNFQGLILGSVRTTTIETLLRKNWIGKTGEILLANREGILITEPRYVEVLVEKGIVSSNSRMNVKLTDDILLNIRAGEDGAATWVDYLGQRVMGAYRHIPQREWTLIGSIGEEEVFGPIYIQLAMMAGSTLLLVLLLLPAATFLTNQIKHPIEWLIRQSQLVAREDYALASQGKYEKSTSREMGNLCDTFTAMSSKIEHTVQMLKENEAELQKLNTDLEDKVQRRTIQLRESKERYEALLQQSVEAIVIVDGDTDVILEVNTAFTRMFGYEPYEAINQLVTSLNIISCDELKGRQAGSAAGHGFLSSVGWYERKNGDVIVANRSGTIINHLGQKIVMLSYRDITEQQKLQAEIAAQVKMAGVVQKSLLPSNYQDDQFTIETIFKPEHLISGDFFGYRLSRDGTKLHGFLLDVRGHGVATALHTSAISILLNDIMEKEHPCDLETLHGFNKQLEDYFRGESFAAVLTFTFDFSRCQLSYVSGGINYSLMSSREQAGKIAMPGIFFGLDPTPDFQKTTIPIQHGDTFYFMTDGLYEKISDQWVETCDQFDATVENLNRVAYQGSHDDCTALCIHITGLK